MESLSSELVEVPSTRAQAPSLHPSETMAYIAQEFFCSESGIKKRMLAWMHQPYTPLRRTKNAPRELHHQESKPPLRGNRSQSLLQRQRRR